MSTSKMIVLVSSDGKRFEVEEKAAMQSQTLKHMIEDGCADSAIPLPNVASKALAKVLEYCKHHADKVKDDDFDKEFVNIDTSFLYYLLLAANFLNIKSLLELICQTVANTIKGKTPEEIRQIYNIKNDFTPEEEEEVRRRNTWEFEE